MRRLLLPSLIVCLASACGGGDQDTGGASADGTAAPPEAAAAPDITCGLADFEADALRLVNQRRAAGARCGARGSFAPAAPLALNDRLTAAAYGHSRDMAERDYFAHDSPEGVGMVERVNAAGYAWSTLGENIAAGYHGVQAVIDGWMSSDDHCANLMNPRFTEFGLACARNDASTYRTYWTQDLGRP